MNYIRTELCHFLHYKTSLNGEERKIHQVIHFPHSRNGLDYFVQGLQLGIELRYNQVPFGELTKTLGMLASLVLLVLGEGFVLGFKTYGS